MGVRISMNVVGGVVAAALTTVGPIAASAKGPAARPASIPHNCVRFHAGRAVGDGEYTDGALQGARGVGCSKAWSLVHPNYHRVIRQERHGVRAFRLGRFRCHFNAQGPATMKICGRPGAVFFFL